MLDRWTEAARPTTARVAAVCLLLALLGLANVDIGRTQARIGTGILVGLWIVAAAQSGWASQPLFVLTHCLVDAGILWLVVALAGPLSRAFPHSSRSYDRAAVLTVLAVAVAAGFLGQHHEWLDRRHVTLAAFSRRYPTTRRINSAGSAHALGGVVNGLRAYVTSFVILTVLCGPRFTAELPIFTTAAAAPSPLASVSRAIGISLHAPSFGSKPTEHGIRLPFQDD